MGAKGVLAPNFITCGAELQTLISDKEALICSIKNFILFLCLEQTRGSDSL